MSTSLPAGSKGQSPREQSLADIPKEFGFLFQSPDQRDREAAKRPTYWEDLWKGLPYDSISLEPSHMRRMVLTVGILCALTLAASSQQQPTPRFEAASVKPNTRADRAFSEIGKGSVVTTNLPMRALINLAHRVRPDRIVGSPAWFDRERFDITARAPAGTPDNLLRPMLQALLQERFRLVFHTEMREMPVYALVVDRGNGRRGPNLKASTQCDPDAMNTLGARIGDPTLPIGKRPCTVISGGDGRGTAFITGGARAIAAVVEALQNPGLLTTIDRPVLDRTGITGTYDFDLRFAAPSLRGPSPDAPALPSIFTALQEQLGLKLETSRGPVEMFVIDSVDRPTPN